MTHHNCTINLILNEEDEPYFIELSSSSPSPRAHTILIPTEGAGCFKDTSGAVAFTQHGPNAVRIHFQPSQVADDDYETDVDMTRKKDGGGYGFQTQIVRVDDETYCEIDRLKPDTTYIFKVKIRCPETNKLSWSNTFEFHLSDKTDEPANKRQCRASPRTEEPNELIQPALPAPPAQPVQPAQPAEPAQPAQPVQQEPLTYENMYAALGDSGDKARFALYMITSGHDDGSGDAPPHSVKLMGSIVEVYPFPPKDGEEHECNRVRRVDYETPNGQVNSIRRAFTSKTQKLCDWTPAHAAIKYIIVRLDKVPEDAKNGARVTDWEDVATHKTVLEKIMAAAVEV